MLQKIKCDTVKGFIGDLQEIENANVCIFLNQDGLEVVDTNQIESILFQDERMRRNFELYPEVILCDATYKLNDRNMPLFVMMTIDGNGETQVAALVILRSENNASIQCALNAFKRLNPNHTKIEVVIVDKSAANISSFETVFPHAAVHISC